VNPDTGEVVEQGADAVQFAFEISVQRAGNAQGYEWVLKPLNERPEAEKAHDKLADMRKLLGNSSVPALKSLAGPTLAATGADQPETAPANGGKSKK
jgi:hypothetical protein